MAWVTLTTDDVLSEFTPNEAATLRNMQGSGSGSGPPFTNIDVITARTIDEVRGFIIAGGYEVDEADDTTLPKGLFADGIAIARWRVLIAAPQLRQLQTEERKKAFDDALAKLNKVVTGEFAVEPPIPPATDITVGMWNSENKILMRTHPVVRPGPQTADDYANPNAPEDIEAGVTPVGVSALGWKYHPEIIALLTADGTPSLQGLATLHLSVSTLIVLVITVGGISEEQNWSLFAGAADPLDPGQVAPADYDLASNNKYWARVG